MNRYPFWKYATIVVALVLGLFYSLPNLFGESPAVQISPLRAGQTLEKTLEPAVRAALKAANIPFEVAPADDEKTLKIRFASEDLQIKAKDVIQRTVGTQYVAALNLMPNTPEFIRKLGGTPMFLGLDLRGGVHFLLEVDMKAALTKKLDSHASDIRRVLKDKEIRFGVVRRAGNQIEASFRSPADAEKAAAALRREITALTVQPVVGQPRIVAFLSPDEMKKASDEAVLQNITTLHNRVNALGVSEPIIQQAGPDRIVVELAGVQDTAKAKDILGRTATLEVRLVDDEHLAAAVGGQVPLDAELLYEAGKDGKQTPILLKRQVELTGDNINNAQPGFDQNGMPAVDVSLDSRGADIFRNLTRDNVGRRMAMVLVERGVSQVVTAPVIRSEIGGGRVQISGAMGQEESGEIAMLLRSGSLAAPMTIIEERTVGPSLGKENIKQGFDSTLWGFAAIVVFMVFYYRLFGVISAAALATNLLLLLAILSFINVTLTLPGIAAIALALGMAIDSNVLVNERIREELRAGASPQMAIQAGYERAWHTILDSNVTTLIAGAALLVFGTGPIKGFAIVHCLGILTSMFSAVFVSRGLVNLIHGGRRLKKLWV